jgi:acetyl-CoA carboxylase biotin carboxyl carrier protein
MDFKEIQELIKLINKSNLTEFKMQDGDFKLSVRTKKYGKLKNNQQQIVSVPAAPLPVQPGYVASAAAPAPPLASETVSSDDKGKQEAADSEDTSSYLEIRSPMVGTFYRSPSPDKPSYLQVGDNVQEGSVVCIVEAMKLFNEIESEVSGKVVKIMVEDASPVEYDQVLFLVDPKG